MKKKPSRKAFFVLAYTMIVIGVLCLYAHKPASPFEIFLIFGILTGYVALLYRMRNPRQKKSRKYENKVHFS